MDAMKHESQRHPSYQLNGSEASPKFGYIVIHLFVTGAGKIDDITKFLFQNLGFVIKIQKVIKIVDLESIMPKHHFLLTYSVSPFRSGDKESRAADKVRRKIAELQEWRKLDNVETAFEGQIYLVSNDIEGKRSEAEKDITMVFKALLDELDAYSDVWVSIALSVDKLGACIEFRV